MKHLWPYLVIITLAAFAWPSIWTPGKLLCTAVDAGHFLYRLHEISWLFERGVLWPRWAPNWSYGYGYPTPSARHRWKGHVGTNTSALGALSG